MNELKRKVGWLIGLKILVFFLAPAVWAADYSGGSGTESDPYQIANAKDLITLSQTSGDWNQGYYFIQTADIAFDADETQVDWNNDEAVNSSDSSGFTPIGNNSTKFNGNYDGGGHTISNLFIETSDSQYVGLFGRTSSAELKNIALINVYISCSSSYAGGLVGYFSLAVG